MRLRAAASRAAAAGQGGGRPGPQSTDEQQQGHRRPVMGRSVTRAALRLTTPAQRAGARRLKRCPSRPVDGQGSRLAAHLQRQHGGAARRPTLLAEGGCSGRCPAPGPAGPGRPITPSPRGGAPPRHDLEVQAVDQRLQALLLLHRQHPLLLPPAGCCGDNGDKTCQSWREIPPGWVVSGEAGCLGLSAENEHPERGQGHGQQRPAGRTPCCTAARVRANGVAPCRCGPGQHGLRAWLRGTRRG